MFEQGEPPFHVVSVGWSLRLIVGVLDRIEARTDWRFSHINVAQRDLDVPDDRAQGRRLFFVRLGRRLKLPDADPELLSRLEHANVPTIHNMIMSDRLARHLDYDEVLAYATYLAGRFTQLYQELEPAILLGGFDSLHSGIALAVAQSLGIPWFALHFTTLPRGLSGFCAGLTPDRVAMVGPYAAAERRSLAERTIDEFERRAIVIPTYLSANTATAVIRRLPRHMSVLNRAISRLLTGRFDKFTEYPVSRLCWEWLRKRWNLVTLPTRWFYDRPPTAPYVFFGLHMQPESSIDVWAPFYANQPSVIESIARALPPTHQLLVKLHKSDADNYSRGELNRIRRLPGVRLVSPFAPSRAFLDNASLVIAIQGTIGLEAALLGKPVLTFGASKLVQLPSVTMVNAITELPELIRRKLSEESPPRDAIVDGLTSYLSPYAPGCYNDWEHLPTDPEIEDLTAQFEALRSFVTRQKAATR